MSIATISPKRLHDAILAGEDIELIDVRTPIEYEEVHVGLARNLPLDQLDPAQLAARRQSSQKPLYVICRSGSRAKQACEQLLRSGHSNVLNVEGGTQAWDAAGLPVVRGQKMISLERQVRIAAGLLVVLGVSLGYFVHPYWLGLPAFVGAGLVFAGITDTCGMGMMLAQMPWNQVKSSKDSTVACCKE